MTTSVRTLAIGATLVAAGTLQSTQQEPRRLEVAATSAERYVAGVSIRELSSGNLLVAEGRKGRLLLLDSTLRIARVVIDSVGEVPGSPSVFSPILIPGRADSTFFVNGVEPLLYPIGPRGDSVGRVRGFPRASDLRQIRPLNGVPGIDWSGRLVYLEQRATNDSAYLLAASFGTRTIDSLTRIAFQSDMTADRRMHPAPRADAWRVLDDGSILIVHADRLLVERIDANGRTALGSLAYPQRRILFAEKQILVDSMRAVYDRASKEIFQQSGLRIVSAVVDAKDIPDTLPAFITRNMLAAPGGGMWLMERSAPGVWEGYTFLVVARDGSLAGRVKMDKEQTLVGLGRRSAYACHATVGETGCKLQRLKL